MSTFAEDLKVGQAVERQVADWLRKKVEGARITFNESKNLHELRHYDFILETDSIKLAFEVKLDRRTFSTGNVCVEDMCVKHSKADFFVYKIGDFLYFIALNKLRSLCKFEYSVYGGDANKLLYLIPFSIFMKNSKVKHLK